ncbi:lysine-rich arabinogalactan protein 19-like [Cynara cardunculus var. scolymus]|uniref:lysine-rich arabinogalactan protein 19-like n=1 Tax=Cynara cardunculus var. scolymus TaxID=59895 RepID=UPI000D62C6CB|nr:lysine-rich arabinogalactan protein 19-like [Cynara cardunculus var. scolymus]
METARLVEEAVEKKILFKTDEAEESKKSAALTGDKPVEMATDEAMEKGDRRVDEETGDRQLWKRRPKTPASEKMESSTHAASTAADPFLTTTAAPFSTTTVAVPFASTTVVTVADPRRPHRRQPPPLLTPFRPPQPRRLQPPPPLSPLRAPPSSPSPLRAPPSPCS